MTRERIVETNSFECEDDSGNRYTIVELTTMRDATALGDTQKKEIAGIPEYRTSPGEHVKRKDDGSFEIVGSGIVLWPIR